MLQLGLPGLRAQRRRGQRVDTVAQELAAPVHRDIGLRGRHGVGAARRQHQAAATRAHGDQVAIGHAQAHQVLRVQVDAGLGCVAEQTTQRAGARHAVPLVAQTAGVQRKGEARVAGLGHRFVSLRSEAGPAVSRREDAVFVQAFAALGGARRVGPALRAQVQAGPVEPGDIEVAAACALAVLVPDRFSIGIGEERRLTRPQKGFQTLGEVTGDGPVGARRPRRRHRGAHAADAALAVGDRAFLFAPRTGGQQQMGVAAGGGAGKGFLQHDELGALQCAQDGRLVGQALRGIGAGDPQGLDLAVGGGLEHLHRGLARFRGHAVHAPQACHFVSVFGIAQIAVRRQQRGHATDLASAHRIGLASERKRPGAGPADLPGGQVQVDQRGVFRGAAAALV